MDQVISCNVGLFVDNIFDRFFFYERPAGIPTLRDLLPGLTFIEPYWWQLITGKPQGMLEGAF